MGKWLKRTNVVAILVAGTGAVHQFVFMHPAAGWPKWEKQMMGSQAQQVTAAAKLAELDHCGEAAVLIHSVKWASACMFLAEEADARRAACLRDPLVMENPQLGKAHCEKTYGAEDDSPDCTLPPARAAVLNASLQEAEDRCLEQAGAKSRPGSTGKSTVARD